MRRLQLISSIVMVVLVVGATIWLTGASHASSYNADIDGDGTVSLPDLSIMLSHWNEASATYHHGDVNGDGKIDITDLSVMLNQWNTHPTSSSSPSPTATPSPSPVAVVPTGVPGSWNLAFDDEFNGNALDLTKWSNCWFSPGCGKVNNVTTSPANVSESGGNLVLTLASSSSGATVSSDPDGGAGVGYQFQYGVVEARMFIPGDGTHCYNWGAFWIDGHDWPNNGENDVAETLGGNMTTNYHSPSGGHSYGSPAGAAPGSWCGAWHTYTVNRQAGHVDVYYDGTLVHSYATDDNGGPQYIIFNTGATGSGPSYPAYGTASQIKVDYVRAWQ